MLSGNKIKAFWGASACAITLLFSGCAVQSNLTQSDIELKKDLSPIEKKDADRSDSVINLREIF